MKINAYITDLDGTLCDTRMANIVSYEQAFRDAGLDFSRNKYEESFGLRYDEMIALLAPSATDEQKTTIKYQKQMHYANNLDLIKINDGLVLLLNEARNSNKKLGLATTAQSANALAVLRHFSLDTLFDEMIFGEEVNNGKPNPECYNIIISKLEVQPDECLVFEDSDIGVEAALAAGAKVLKVSL